MPTIATFITSKTWDYKNKCMYPDKDVVDRELEDVERLIVEGHTIEWRSENLIMTLTMDKFNEIVKPLFPDYYSIADKIESPIENVITGRPLPPDGTYVNKEAEGDLIPKEEVKPSTIKPGKINKIEPTEEVNTVKIATPKEEEKKEDKKEEKAK